VVPADTSTLKSLLVYIERTFRNLDWERTAHTQLHALKMMTGMMEDEYTAKFKMLAGRTGFNNTALENTYV